MGRREAERVIMTHIERILVLWHVPEGETVAARKFCGLYRSHAGVKAYIELARENGLVGGRWISEECIVCP